MVPNGDWVASPWFNTFTFIECVTEEARMKRTHLSIVKNSTLRNFDIVRLLIWLFASRNQNFYPNAEPQKLNGVPPPHPGTSNLDVCSRSRKFLPICGTSLWDFDQNVLWKKLKKYLKPKLERIQKCFLKKLFKTKILNNVSRQIGVGP